MRTPVGVDEKTLSRVKKLLALAADGGATEHEAALAMDRAQEIMRAHGLEIAQVEAAGGAGEDRARSSARGRAGKPWMREIMRALADSSFVYADYRPGERRYDYESDTHKMRQAEWTLIGRKSAVVQVGAMHEYLCRTVDRVARERDTPTDELFKSAMGERLAARIDERHETMLAQQRAEADAERSRRENSGHGSTSGALVVVLEDFAQSERDRNEDMRRGVPEGTTRAKRENDERERAARDAARAALEKELTDRGVPDDVAWYVLNLDLSEEEARARVARDEVSRAAEAAAREQETPEQRARRERCEERESEEFYERMCRERERRTERLRHPSYRAGRAAAESVGLDTQVGRGPEQRRIR